MDIKLQNAYVKVVLDNFMEVVKQNLLFQAQLEIMKSDLVDKETLQRQVQELSEINEQIKSNVTAQSNNLTQEQKRLQSAVNEYMKKNKTLEEELAKVKSELVEKNKYIKKTEKQKVEKKEEVPATPEKVEEKTIASAPNSF